LVPTACATAATLARSSSIAARELGPACWCARRLRRPAIEDERAKVAAVAQAVGTKGQP